MEGSDVGYYPYDATLDMQSSKGSLLDTIDPCQYSFTGLYPYSSGYESQKELDRCYQEEAEAMGRHREEVGWTADQMVNKAMADLVGEHDENQMWNLGWRKVFEDTLSHCMVMPQMIFEAVEAAPEYSKIVHAYREAEARATEASLEDLTQIYPTPAWNYNEAMRYVYRTKQLLSVFCLINKELMINNTAVQALGTDNWRRRSAEFRLDTETENWTVAPPVDPGVEDYDLRHGDGDDAFS
jgi:hypothetical protein